MKRLLLGAIAVAVLVGCHAPESDTPIAPPGTDRLPSAPTAPSEPGTTRRRDRKASWNASGSSTPSATRPTTSGSENAAQSPPLTSAPVTEKPRDLSEELRRLLGDPSACFSKRTAGSGPPVLHFDVSAAVTPTGMVNRAKVTGGGLDAEEAACLESIVVRARFKGPVDGAPLNVQAAVELREQPKPQPAPASP